GQGNLTITTNVGAGGNDLCQDATIISTLPFTETVTTTTAFTTEGPTPTCQANASRDVWWLYSPPQDQFIRIDTCGSVPDTVLTVFTGTCAGLIDWACDDNSCSDGVAARISNLPVFQGNNYRIRVSGRQGAVGAITLNVAMEAACATCTGDLTGDNAVDGAD